MPTMGSQRLLQIAVNSRPELTRSALRRAGAIGKAESIEWVSPLSSQGYREYPVMPQPFDDSGPRI